MIIVCPSCGKNFNVRDDQIPDKGRLLQCSNCKHEWFYTKNTIPIDDNIDENLFFTLLNIIDQDNKFLIVTSVKSIVEISFKLNDLNSRSKNFLLSQIEQPEDDLMYALILKNLSDRQISINKKLIDFIIKRITRSYGKISDFIYKIDKISLKRKKPIDFKIIKEALGE